MKKILAAVDFSEVSQAVVEQAAELAEAFSAELTLVHVAAPDPDFVGFEAGPQSVRDSRAAGLRDEHRALQNLATELRDRSLSAHALLIQGPAIKKILEEGERIAADMIVIGSHGHGALYRVLLGSVSEGVVRGARCPVLVIPAESSTDGSTDE